MVVQMGLFWGALRDRIRAQLATLVAPWFQGGSRAPKRSHFESLWGVFWRYFGVCFVWFFTRNVEVVFQDCGNFRPYFLIKDCNYYQFTCFLRCFAFVYAYSVDVVEAAPPGAAEDHWSCWDMQRRGHHFCCTCVCSSGEYNSCATFFLQCSSLERASRSLAKTGFYFYAFFGLFWSLFLSPFSVRLFEVLERSLGALGSILEPFGEHLGVILVTFLG